MPAMEKKLPGTYPTEYPLAESETKNGKNKMTVHMSIWKLAVIYVFE